MSAATLRRLSGDRRAEPRFDVFNEQGEKLMVGVSHRVAIMDIEAIEKLPDIPPRWQGEMRIKSQRLGRQSRQTGGAA